MSRVIFPGDDIPKDSKFVGELSHNLLPGVAVGDDPEVSIFLKKQIILFIDDAGDGGCAR